MRDNFENKMSFPDDSFIIFLLVEYILLKGIYWKNSKSTLRIIERKANYKIPSF